MHAVNYGYGDFYGLSLYQNFTVDKRDGFDFTTVNFPFLCSNIPLSPAYGVYISQLIRYAKACFAYEDFSKRGKLLTNKLILQSYNESCLKSSFRKLQMIASTYDELFVSYNLLEFHFHTGFDDG
jgi:hypothetical protein